jgi:uncharacterized damage-inducible protein DinB
MENTTEVIWEPPVAGSEVDTLLGSLERQRATFAWKVGNLGPEGMRARLGPSAVTLGGLLKHMALCEDHMWSVKFLGQGLHAPFDAVDWDDEPDWEWNTALEDDPQDLMALWSAAVDRARVVVDEALAAGGLDGLSSQTWPDGRTPSLRRLLIDMIEEYARHVGHADLIRESIDGLVGEDPPR